MFTLVFTYKSPNGILEYEIIEEEKGEKYISLKKSANAIGDMIIPSTINDIPVKRIGPAAFYANSELTSIVIPNTVNTIEHTAFGFCESLKNVELSENLKELSISLFTNCSSLESIKIPKNVSVINDYAFEYCESLKSVQFNEKLKEIGIGAFFKCDIRELNFPDSLVEIRMDAFNLSGVEKITCGTSLKTINNGAFAECERLESVSFNDGIEIIDDHAFTLCYNLKTFIMPDSLLSLGHGAIDSCLSLEHVHIGKNTEIKRTIGGFCNGCPALRDISISDGNENYVLEKGVLYNNTKNVLIKMAPKSPYKNIIIPESVTKVYQHAMSDINGKTLRFKNTSLVGISESSISLGKNILVYCHENSDIEEFCKRKGIKYSIFSKLNDFLIDIADDTKNLEDSIGNN